MPGPLPIELRRQIVERRQSGEKLTIISAELNVSYNTTKKIWAHWRKHGKLTPNYAQAKQRGTRQYGQGYQAAIDMKRDHPGWGATLIGLRLREQYPETIWPSDRTLRRWFRQAGVARSPKVQRSRSPLVRRGQAVHQVWAVDAKEQMKLADGTNASWLMVTDEASGAVLDAQGFPPGTVDDR